MVKSYSSYNSKNLEDEKNAALEFAKKRNQNHIENIRKSSDFLEKEEKKALDKKKLDEEKNEELKRVLLIPDSVIQDNIKVAQENNKKFANILDQTTLTNELLDSLFEKN